MREACPPKQAALVPSALPEPIVDHTIRQQINCPEFFDKGRHYLPAYRIILKIQSVPIIIPGRTLHRRDPIDLTTVAGSRHDLTASGTNLFRLTELTI